MAAMICMKIETISVPTTAAAELRVTVERSTPMAAIALSGSRYASVPAPVSTSARPASMRVPDSVVSGSKPQTSPPTIRPTLT